MESMLTFTNVSYLVGDTQILSGVSLNVPRGARVMITGPSGSGKSTLLRLAGGFASASDGTIRLEDTDVLSIPPEELHARIGMCFQTPTLFGTTVRDNLEFPFLARALLVDEPRMCELLGAVGLDSSILQREHKALSGGERQRVALARALVVPPSVLLLDEVTSALDTDSARVIEQLVLHLNERDGLTVLWVSHNDEQVARMGTHEARIVGGKIAWVREASPTQTTSAVQTAESATEEGLTDEQRGSRND